MSDEDTSILSKTINTNGPDDQHVNNYVPFMLKWVGHNVEYMTPNGGGDCFLLPISRTTLNGKSSETTEDVILLDSGPPLTLLNIISSLGYDPTIPDMGKVVEPEASPDTQRVQRILKGVIITHDDNDHIGGFIAMLAFALMKEGVGHGIEKQCLRYITTQILDSIAYVYPDTTRDAIFTSLCNSCSEALRDIQFVVCSRISGDHKKTSHIHDLMPDAELIHVSGRAPTKPSPNLYTVAEDIFVSSCARVILSFPRVPSSEVHSILYWKRTTHGLVAQMYPHVPTGTCYRSFFTPTEKNASDRSVIENDHEAPRHEPDTSIKNMSSIITCYIGQYDDISGVSKSRFHYAFGGDSIEDVAMKARRRLPPNAHVFDGMFELASDGDVRGRHIITSEDLFKPDKSMEGVRRVFLKFCHSNLKKMNEFGGKWDMMQLNHHGSIKNVMDYEESGTVRDHLPFSPCEVMQQLSSKAHGFFVTSPGTFYHANPLILEALSYLAVFSAPEPANQNVAADCRVVTVAFPTIKQDGSLHEQYSALVNTGVSHGSFSRSFSRRIPTSPEYINLIPYCQSFNPMSHLLTIEEKLTAKLAEIECNMPSIGHPNELVHSPDLRYRITQLKCLHADLHWMIFAIKVVTRTVPEQDAAVDAIRRRISNICRRYTNMIHGDAPTQSQRILHRDQYLIRSSHNEHTGGMLPIAMLYFMSLKLDEAVDSLRRYDPEAPRESRGDISIHSIRDYMLSSPVKVISMGLRRLFASYLDKSIKAPPNTPELRVMVRRARFAWTTAAKRYHPMFKRLGLHPTMRDASTRGYLLLAIGRTYGFEKLCFNLFTQNICAMLPEAHVGRPYKILNDMCVGKLYNYLRLDYRHCGLSKYLIDSDFAEGSPVPTWLKSHGLYFSDAELLNDWFLECLKKNLFNTL